MILPQLAYNDATGMVLVGTNLWHHKSILKEAKGYNRRAVITDGFFDGSTNIATARFTEKFKALFNTSPKFLEAISYDTASILFLTAMEESVDSRQMLKNALQGKRLFEGVTGKTIFDEEGKLLSWYKPEIPGAGYDHIINLASEFLLVCPVEPTTNLPLYMLYAWYSSPAMVGQETFDKGLSGSQDGHTPACTYANFVQSLAVKYYAYRSPTSGRVVVSLDGIERGAFDLKSDANSEGQRYVKIFEALDFDNTTHTIVITCDPQDTTKTIDMLSIIESR